MSKTPEHALISPWDSHNQTLITNVRPHDWKNPQPAPRYNLVVIGAGTAGLVTAAGAAGLGAKVALIEITVAIAGQVCLSKLGNVIHPYPTEAEAIKKAGDAWNRSPLTPAVKCLFTRWLNWTR